MATLYRKYRPQTFAEAVGQNYIKITLQNEIGAGKIAHAYLFCGPRAVGKTTFARLFAKAVNCPARKEGEFEPCNKCDSCLDIINGKSLDIMEIDAASHTGVDNVRENIIASARVASSKSKYKIFIIDEVHMLSISAFNALLKVIEEPPAHVIFILCTTEAHKVPATIISRCERFDFRRIGLNDMVLRLSRIAKKEGVKIEKDILEAISRQADGHMRDAESLFGQIVAIAGSEITREEADLIIPRSDMAEIVNLVEILSKKDAAAGISLINRLLDDGVNLEKFLEDLIEVLRKIMLGKISAVLEEKFGLDLGENFEMKINEIKEDLFLERLIIFLEKFMKAKLELKSSFIIQLPIELAITELCEDGGPVIKKAGENPLRPDTPPQKVFRPLPTGAKISQEALLERWSEFLAKIKRYNHSLSFILRVCKPIKLEGNRLCLAFKYKFHQDRINEEKIRELVQNVLKEVYESPLIIETVIDESLEVEGKVNGNGNGENIGNKGNEEKNSPKADEFASAAAGEKGNNAMDNLLKTFGGKIIK